jgi:hypothetical protein
MPVNVVKTPRDERLWDKAKKQAEKQGHTKDWAYVMGIYQHMKGISKSEDLGKSMVLPRAAEYRIPGQVPTQAAIASLAGLTARPAPMSEARFLAQSGHHFSVDSVVQGLGLNLQGQAYWKKALEDIIYGSKNELVLKQRLIERLIQEKADLGLRKALYERAVIHWKDTIQKSLVQVVPVEELQGEVLEKAEPRGGQYHKRIPRGDGGYTYIYDPAKYQARKDAHVDGKEARKGHIIRHIEKRVRRAGKNGLHISELADLSTKHGADAVAEVLKDHCDRGVFAFEKGSGTFTRARNRFVERRGPVVINLDKKNPRKGKGEKLPKPTTNLPGSKPENASQYKPKI